MASVVVMAAARVLSASAVALLLAGCEAATNDQSGSTTPTSSAAAAPTASMTPAATPPTGPSFRDYLASLNVRGQPVKIEEATGLAVTVPVPDGWLRTTDPLFAAGLVYVQPRDSGGRNPPVTVMAIRLDGAFDPKAAIQHADVDALPSRATDVTTSLADFQGFPSVLAEGTANGDQHYNRIVLATTHSNQHYLVQLTVSAPLAQPIASSPALSSIVDGFTVTAT